MSWIWIAAILAIIVVLALLARRGESGGLSATRDAGSYTQIDVDEKIRAGRKIDAIRIHRLMNGVGLKESKEAVEARTRELGL